MSLFQLIGIALTAAVVCRTLQSAKPEFFLPTLLVSGAVVLLALAPQIASLIDAIRRMAQNCGIADKYMQIVVKTAGIACVCSVASSMCRDVGLGALGEKIELGGRLSILALSMPVVTELYYVIIQCIG